MTDEIRTWTVHVGLWFFQDSDFGLGLLDIGFQRTRNLVFLTDSDKDFHGIRIVFLGIPTFALRYHSSCDGSKALAGNWIFSFQGFGFLRFFRIRILHVWILDLATNILVGPGLFLVPVFQRFLRLRFPVFSVSGRYCFAAF